MQRPEQAGAAREAREARERQVREAKRQLKQAERKRKAYTRRQDSRFRAPARRRLVRWGVAAGAVILVASLVFVVLYSPLLQVRRVTFSGLDRTDEASVSEAISWVKGENFTRLDQDRVLEDLSSFSTIQSVSLTAQLPGTLVVTVTERQPVGVMKRDNTFELVDAAGVTIETFGKRPSAYPLLELAGASTGVFSVVVTVLGQLPDGLASDVDRIVATTRDDVPLYTEDGVTVIWGSDEDGEEKAKVYTALKEAKPKATVIDVSAPLTPIVR